MVGEEEEFVLLSKRRGLRKNLLPICLWMVLICVFAVVLIPPFFVRDCRRMGPLTHCKSNLRNIGTAMEMYSTDWCGHYPKNMEALVPEYLKSIPECPAAGFVSYRAGFGPKVPLNHPEYEDYYLIECAGHHHWNDAIPPDYPKYDGLRGLYERPDLESLGCNSSLRGLYERESTETRSAPESSPPPITDDSARPRPPIGEQLEQDYPVFDGSGWR